MFRLFFFSLFRFSKRNKILSTISLNSVRIFLHRFASFPARRGKEREKSESAERERQKREFALFLSLPHHWKKNAEFLCFAPMLNDNDACA